MENLYLATFIFQNSNYVDSTIVRLVIADSYGDAEEKATKWFAEENKSSYFNHVEISRPIM